MNPWSGLKKLPKNIWLISITALINRMGMMVLPFLVLYLTKERGISTGDAGLIIAFYGLGALLSAPFVGKLSDKIGAMNLMKASLFVSGIILIFLSFLTNYYLIILTIVILAVVAEAFRPASMAFISNGVEASSRKTAFALYRLAINLGMSIGPVLGGILSTINFSLLFYVDGLTSIAAGIFLLFSKFEPETLEEEQLETGKFVSKNILKDFRYLYFLLAIMPVMMVFFQHMSTMPLFIVEELGYSNATFGLLIAVNTVLIIILEVPLNTLMEKIKEWKSLMWGAVLCGIGFGGLAFNQSMSGIVLMIVIWTFGEMIFFPSASSYASEISPRSRRGEYMGYLQMTFGLSFAIAPWLGTQIYEIYGSSTLWYGTFFFSLTSALMMPILIKLDKERIH